MKDKREALQGCPFCGENEATLESFDVVTDGEAGEFAGVRCNHCGINFFTDGTEEHMIRDWNTRSNARERSLREEIAGWKENFKNMMIERDDYIKKLAATMGKARKLIAGEYPHTCNSNQCCICKALAILNEAEGKL